MLPIVSAFGRDIKSLLVTQLRVQAEICREDPDLDREVNAVLATVDDITISAGGYVSFTKGFLLSFYGILATYIALLIQTV